MDRQQGEGAGHGLHRSPVSRHHGVCGLNPCLLPPGNVELDLAGWSDGVMGPAELARGSSTSREMPPPGQGEWRPVSSELAFRDSWGGSEQGVGKRPADKAGPPSASCTLGHKAIACGVFGK